MSSNALYTDLSHYYDLMCADIDYRAQSDSVRRLQQLFGNPGRRHLDLACGTGPHVRHFLDFGYRSAGLDINQPMLDIAQARCPEAAFSRQDMASFRVDEPQDLITCFLYSIHYNPDLQQLRACLASVHDALAEDGVFCFNTVDKGQIDNRSFVRHTVEHEGSLFTFGSGWHYPGKATARHCASASRRQRRGHRELAGRTPHGRPDLRRVAGAVAAAVRGARLRARLRTHHPWNGTSGNALFVCVKR